DSPLHPLSQSLQSKQAQFWSSLQVGHLSLPARSSESRKLTGSYQCVINRSGGIMIRKCFAGFSSFSTPKPFEVRSIVRVIAFCLLIMAVDGATSAATLPAGFSETLVANGLSSPTAMDFALDGRLFVCLQG